MRLQLPEADEDSTTRRLVRGHDAVEARPPSWVAHAIQGIVRHLDGESQDFSRLPLDLSGVAPFARRVYASARATKAGQTITYGELSLLAGAPGAARAVGRVLGANPFGLVVPCHRVVGAGGRIGGFSAHGGRAIKAKLLALEGADVPAGSAPTGRADRLGFDVEHALRHLRNVDRSLGALIDEVGPLRLDVKKTSSAFAALAEAIVYQQLTGKAAATIFGRVKALYPKRRFPLPNDLIETPDRSLRGAGLSRSKALALKDLAGKVIDGTVPSVRALRRMEDEHVVEKLTVVRGVGRWTAQMFLIFRLGRPDVLPVDDYGLRKGFGVAFGRRSLPTPDEVTARGERWRPYRTVAARYLWRAVERARAR